MRRCVWSRNLKNEEAMARFGPQRHREIKLKNLDILIYKVVFQLYPRTPLTNFFLYLYDLMITL